MFGPRPVGQHDEVGEVALAPPEDRPQRRHRTDRAVVAGGRIGQAERQQHLAAGGHDEGAGSVVVELGHERLDGVEVGARRALRLEVVAHRPPVLVRALGGVVELLLGGQGDGDERPLAVEEAGQLGRVLGADGVRDGASGGFHASALPGARWLVTIRIACWKPFTSRPTRPARGERGSSWTRCCTAGNATAPSTGWR
jgi:hypothetical protein